MFYHRSPLSSGAFSKEKQIDLASTIATTHLMGSFLFRCMKPTQSNRRESALDTQKTSQRKEEILDGFSNPTIELSRASFHFSRNQSRATSKTCLTLMLIPCASLHSSGFRRTSQSLPQECIPRYLPSPPLGTGWVILLRSSFQVIPRVPRFLKEDPLINSSRTTMF